MLRIDVTTVISRPVQDVWDFFVDLTNSPRWTQSGSELRPTSKGPLGLGTTIVGVRTMLGREIKSQTLVVTQFEPGRLIGIAADVKLLGHVPGAVTFENVAGRTRLSRWTEVDLGRAERLLGPLLARLLRSGQGTELANLKRLIEAGP